MKPIVVDLDGTLIHTDMLIESASKFVVQHPFQFFMLAVWALRGKSVLKSELAQRVNIDVSTLPYNGKLLDWLRAEKVSGRQLVLATASHRLYAEQIAQHLHIFDEVLATEGDVNLKATAKALALAERFGEQGFDYVGNDWPDLDVWAISNEAHLANVSDSLQARVLKLGKVGCIFHSDMPSSLGAMFKAMRLHQWVKNFLVFVPLLAAHQYMNAELDALAFLAFLAFCFTASSVYLLNDLVDVQDDRQHARKRFRPFASGALSLLAGWMAWPIMLMIAVLLSVLYLPVMFTSFLCLYFILTVAYSLQLKQLAVVDVLALAILYTLRIIGGTFAVNLTLSFWLLLFSMFIFLSLALIKRYSELKNARDTGQIGSLRGRGYDPNDLDLVSSLGSSAGLMSVLILALYIQDSQGSGLYANPSLIWLVCPIMLFWVCRAWLIAFRGQMHDDPIVFALKDKVSWWVGLSIVLVFSIARYI